MEHNSEENEEVVLDDRISSLDDNILIHIVSYLTTDEAVRTGVLSKRWAYLWTLVPCLDFDCRRDIFEDDANRFSAFVDKTLLFHNCTKIKRFRLYVDFECDGDFHYDIDTWVRFASLKNVAEIDVFTKAFDVNYDLYRLPMHLFGCSSLTKMRWAYCDARWFGEINWSLLTDLSFENCDLSEDFIDDMLLHTPALQSLRFYECYGLSNLRITSPTLKKLVIGNGQVISDGPVLEIEAPYLSSLSIVGVMSKNIQLGDLSSLTDAELDFNMESCLLQYERDEEDDKTMFRRMLERLCHVTDLLLGTWCISCLPKSNVKRTSMPLLKCKRLVLKTEVLFDDFPTIGTLLHSSCELEELTLDLSTDFNTIRHEKCSRKRYCTSCKMRFSRLASHLKMVKVIHRRVPSLIGEPLLTLLQFLLKEASVLERLFIIEAKSGEVLGDDTLARKHDSTQKLLSFERSSPHAVIIFR